MTIQMKPFLVVFQSGVMQVKFGSRLERLFWTLLVVIVQRAVQQTA